MEDKFKGKRNSNGFALNPQNINRKGRPKKGFYYVNKTLEEKGFEKLEKKDYLDFVSFMMNCTEEELKKLAMNKSLPLFLRLMIGEMKNPKTRNLIMKDLRDFLFGKAAQDLNVDVKIKARVLTTEEAKAYMKDLEENL